MDAPIQKLINSTQHGSGWHSETLQNERRGGAQRMFYLPCHVTYTVHTHTHSTITYILLVYLRVYERAYTTPEQTEHLPMLFALRVMCVVLLMMASGETKEKWSFYNIIDAHITHTFSRK